MATCLLHSVPETESRCSPDRSGLSNSCRIKYRGGASCTSSVPVSSFCGAAAVGACSGCREDISVWRSGLPVQATSSRGREQVQIPPSMVDVSVPVAQDGPWRGWMMKAEDFGDVDLVVPSVVGVVGEGGVGD